MNQLNAVPVFGMFNDSFEWLVNWLIDFTVKTLANPELQFAKVVSSGDDLKRTHTIYLLLEIKHIFSE